MNMDLQIVLLRLVLATSGVWVFGIVAYEFWKLRNNHKVFASCATFFIVMFLAMAWLSLNDLLAIYYRDGLRATPMILRTGIVLAGAWLAWTFRIRI